jgi:hypothetical protein
MIERHIDLPLYRRAPCIVESRSLHPAPSNFTSCILSLRFSFSSSRNRYTSAGRSPSYLRFH